GRTEKGNLGVGWCPRWLQLSLIPQPMRIELLSEVSVGPKREAWLHAVEAFRWERDPDLAAALYVAVPRSTEFYFVSGVPTRTGRVTCPTARPAPDLVADALDAQSLLLFPESLAWALRYSADPAQLAFGFPV